MHPVWVSFRCSCAVPFWSFFVVFLNPLACISGSILSNQIWGSVSYTVVPSCSLVALTSPFVKLLHPPGKGSHWKAARECLEHLWVHPQKAWALLTLPARGLLFGGQVLSDRRGREMCAWSTKTCWAFSPLTSMYPLASSKWELSFMSGVKM